MGEHYRLTISIGKRPTTSEAAIRQAMALAFFMAFPVVNHWLLGGNWPLDALGIVFGFLFFVMAIRTALGRHRTFETPEAAAQWVLSREWERSE